MARVQEVSDATGHLPGQQRQSVPAGRPEDDHVPGAGSARWEVPDWIVVPGGNLGNSSAFGKAFIELQRAGPDRPRAAAGGDQRGRRQHALRTCRERGLRWNGGQPDTAWSTAISRDGRASARASTIASAIEINRPVNLKKCLRALESATASSARSPIRRSSTPRPRSARAAWAASRPARPASPVRNCSFRGRHRPRRARRLHPHRPSTQGPDGHGRLPHDRSGTIR